MSARSSILQTREVAFVTSARSSKLETCEVAFMSARSSILEAREVYLLCLLEAAYMRPPRLRLI